MEKAWSLEKRFGLEVEIQGTVTFRAGVEGVLGEGRKVQAQEEKWSHHSGHPSL